MNPPDPMAIDQAQDSGRPEPRRMQYPVGWNLSRGTPGSEGLKLASFATLRYIADIHSVTRACINLRTNEILGLDWDIVATEEASLAMKDNETALRDFNDRRRQALQFFKRPDPNYPNFHGWLAALLEEHFVCDAVSLYLHPARVKGKGLLGSDLAALDLLDGSTIRPLLDARGGTPEPPNAAYQAYEWGVPRADLMNPFSGRELDELSGSVKTRLLDEYRGDQLLYLRRTTRTWTPYGFPPVEQALIPATTQLRKQEFRLEFFTEGSIPGMFVIVGDAFQPEQVRQMQDTLNAIAGDSAWKHKIIVLPAGSSADPQKPISLAGPDDEFLYQETLMAFSIQPMELGLMPKVSTSGPSAGAANQMAKMATEHSERKGLRPMLEWLADGVFNFVLHEVCQQHDMEFRWVGLDSEEDEDTKAKRLDTEIRIGLRSVDEGRAELGLDAWGLDMTSNPLYCTPTGVVSLAAPPPAPVDPAATANEAENGVPAKKPEESPHEQAKPQPDQVQDGGDVPVAKLFGEIDTLRRLLKKGRSIDSFKPAVLPKAWLARASALPGDDAVIKLRQLAKAEGKRQDREEEIAVITAAIAATVAVYVAKVQAGEATGEIDELMKTLEDELYKAAQAGADYAADRYGVDKLTAEELRKIAADRVASQEPYLKGLLDDLNAGVSRAGVEPAGSAEDLYKALQPRIQLYGRQAKGAFEEAVAQAADGAGEATATWNTLGPNPCGQCDARDGETYTLDELPGYPGDGDFGGELCEGGPNCNCELDWEIAEAAGELPIAAAAKPDVTKAEDELGDTVYAALAENYPEDTLGWVKDAEWRLDKSVPLDDIQMARRPGGRDQDKVDGIAQAIEDGKTMDPVVLVDTPGNDQLEIADGYHRTLAFKKAGRDTIAAYVAKVDTDDGPWVTEMHDKKLNKSRPLDS